MTDHRLTDAEALMWRLEVDPWFQSSFGALTLLDGPIDHDYLQRRLLGAVTKIPRLRQRVVERAADNPVWQTDHEFELSHHYRSFALPDPSMRTLLDTAARLVADPLDRSRPLWRFTVIEGLEGGRSALLTKLHHSVSDGEGSVQMAFEYLDLGPELSETPARAELDQQLHELLEREAPPESMDAVVQALRDTATRQVGRWRGLVGEAAMYVADPTRVTEQASGALSSLRELSADLPSGEASNSLFRSRSRRRHLDHFGFRLEPALAAARNRGGTLNDLLLTMVSHAACGYHAERETELDRLQATFIISTRGDDTGVGNAFSPSGVELPGHDLNLEDRFQLIAGRTEAVKESGSRRSELQQLLAGPARFVPTPGLTALARRQAARIDVATSNLRSAPMPLFVGGSRAIWNVPIGPVAGTACNLTLMSYDDRADLGVHVDPAAITDPAAWTRLLGDAFDQLVPGSHRLLD